jgi:hypothetical protein
LAGSERKGQGDGGYEPYEEGTCVHKENDLLQKSNLVVALRKMFSAFCPFFLRFKRRAKNP